MRSQRAGSMSSAVTSRVGQLQQVRRSCRPARRRRRECAARRSAARPSNSSGAASCAAASCTDTAPSSKPGTSCTGRGPASTTPYRPTADASIPSAASACQVLRRRRAPGIDAQGHRRLASCWPPGSPANAADDPCCSRSIHQSGWFQRATGSVSVAATSASRSRRKRRRQALMKLAWPLRRGAALGRLHGLVDQREDLVRRLGLAPAQGQRRAQQGIGRRPAAPVAPAAAARPRRAPGCAAPGTPAPGRPAAARASTRSNAAVADWPARTACTTSAAACSSRHSAGDDARPGAGRVSGSSIPGHYCPCSCAAPASPCVEAEPGLEAEQPGQQHGRELRDALVVAGHRAVEQLDGRVRLERQLDAAAR